MALVITTVDGICPTIASFPDGEMRIYWIESGSVYVTVVDSAFNVLKAKTACTGIGDVDEDGIAGIIVEAVNGVPTTKLAVLQSGSLVIYSSRDGFTFS